MQRNILSLLNHVPELKPLCVQAAAAPTTNTAHHHVEQGKPKRLSLRDEIAMYEQRNKARARWVACTVEEATSSSSQDVHHTDLEQDHDASSLQTGTSAHEAQDRGVLLVGSCRDGGAMPRGTPLMSPTVAADGTLFHPILDFFEKHFKYLNLASSCTIAPTSPATAKRRASADVEHDCGKVSKCF